jgi:hypothetical protein
MFALKSGGPNRTAAHVLQPADRGGAEQSESEDAFPWIQEFAHASIKAEQGVGIDVDAVVGLHLVVRG